MDSFLRDLRYAVRGLLRSPGFTLAVVATLALGIGANTTMFGVIDTTLLRPPAHVDAPSRVARLYFRVNMMGEDRVNPSTAFPALEALGGVRAFAAVAGFTDGQVSAGLGADARPLRVRAVTASYFPLLGARPALGRFFDSTEDRLGGTPVVVLSHTYWMRQMGGAPDVLQRTLAIGPFVYSVIGVAPDGFTGAELDEPDLWLPIRQAAPVLGSAEALSSWNWIWVQAIARLAPGATRASADGGGAGGVRPRAGGQRRGWLLRGAAPGAGRWSRTGLGSARPRRRGAAVARGRRPSCSWVRSRRRAAPRCRVTPRSRSGSASSRSPSCS